MQRISTATKVVDKFGAGKHGFTNGDVVGGVPATDLEAALFDNLQEELANTAEAAGLVLDGGVRTQVLQALRRMFGGNISTVAAGATVLTLDNAGLVLANAAAGAVTLTLPAANVLKAASFSFRRIDNTANTVTVNRAGADTIDEGITSFALLGQGDVREVVSDGASGWRSRVGPNSALKTAIGYMKFPNGMILQWGGVNAGNGTIVTLPIAFPNGVVSNIATLASAGAVGTQIFALELTDTSLTNFRLYVSSQAAGGGGWSTSTHTVSWLALGY